MSRPCRALCGAVLAACGAAYTIIPDDTTPDSHAIISHELHVARLTEPVAATHVSTHIPLRSAASANAAEALPGQVVTGVPAVGVLVAAAVAPMSAKSPHPAEALPVVASPHAATAAPAAAESVRPTGGATAQRAETVPHAAAAAAPSASAASAAAPAIAAAASAAAPAVAAAAAPALPSAVTAVAAVAAPVVTSAVPAESAGGSAASSSDFIPSWTASWQALEWSVLVETFWRQSARLLELLGGISFAMVVKAGCISSNVLFQVSPLPEAKVWRETASTGGADAAPYVSIALSGCQWCFYGSFATIFTQNSSFLVLVWSNCLGAVLGVYYVATFYRHCKKVENIERLHQYLSAAGSLALLQACAAFAIPATRALSLAGMVGSFCSFLSALSLLVSLPEVINRQDSSDLPGSLLCAGLFSAVCWCICGQLLNDPMVMYPNLFSVFAAGLALAVKLRYAPTQKGSNAKVIKLGASQQDVPVSLSVKKGLALKPYKLDAENFADEAQKNCCAYMEERAAEKENAILKSMPMSKKRTESSEGSDESTPTYNSGTGGTF
eukprot:TRINITY_DN16594_c0_g1_i1.p1 TRINITY_DN16594_c0_g1~~TRINITY_DN16594_c0_g1_i1.p1  ORF type:complete len:555 (-),score=121.04 TRINITY_DN16594_c0_g1_i1:229-1893(-)